MFTTANFEMGMTNYKQPSRPLDVSQWWVKLVTIKQTHPLIYTNIIYQGIIYILFIHFRVFAL